jgi:GTP-binding protein HflX
VVDGSDADPQSQIAAVREVLAEIGAGEVPEVIVINKADVADPITVKGLRLRERGCVLVSARTGEGIDGLLALVEEALPWRDEQVSAVIPYDRSDLVARVHEEGEVLSLRHGADGTELTARVPHGLARELDRVSLPVGSAS